MRQTLTQYLNIIRTAVDISYGDGYMVRMEFDDRPAAELFIAMIPIAQVEDPEGWASGIVSAKITPMNVGIN